MLHGMIMDRPLLISSLLDYAVTYFGGREIVSVTADAPLHRTDYRTIATRAKRLANALSGRFGIKPGDRVATLAWNDHRHLEIYYAVSGMGAVCHTINPRLFEEQITYIVNHANDRLLFVDPMFWPLVQKLLPKLPSLEQIIVMTTADAMPDGSDHTALDYETVLAGEAEDFVWPMFDETAASSLCYTSGTTG
ncbi:MAG: AMP-binding protein, partial [Alphaproteobacteria bacterium]|nr:AMP-binding protein [Alphaproteobacteria bacterium]